MWKKSLKGKEAETLRKIKGTRRTDTLFYNCWLRNSGKTECVFRREQPSMWKWEKKKKKDVKRNGDKDMKGRREEQQHWVYLNLLHLFRVVNVLPVPGSKVRWRTERFLCEHKKSHIRSYTYWNFCLCYIYNSRNLPSEIRGDLI